MHAVEGQKPREQSPREKLLELERRIADRVFEREEEIRGFTVGLLTRSHVLFLGPKGCAKSTLARLLCDAIRWAGVPEGYDSYFRTQLRRDSVLDELFGPISNEGFTKDTFRRKTSGMLSEAKVGVLEELYNSNSTVLKALNTLLGEGLFKNGTDPEVEVPLRLVLGTTNELPDERDDSLDAFHDRFMLRFEVSYLKDSANIRRMMEKANRPEFEELPIDPLISEAELDRATNEAARVDVSGVFDAIDEILAHLADREIVPSDRRRAALVKLVKAQAYLSGREVAVRDDLSILAHALWEEPEQIREVRSAVLAAANPQASQAQDLFDAVTDSYESAMKAHRAARESNSEENREAETNAGMNANTALKNARRKLFELSQTAGEAGSDTALIDTLLEKTGEMNREVNEKCLGL